nr:retrotransposon Orf1 [Tanacetum cinerariifolium]
DSMAFEHIALIGHIQREELRRKGIKSPSNLLSPKYLSHASIIELDKNTSAPKCIHFVNSIVILNKETKDEVKDVLNEEESEVETDEEIKEILKEEEEDEDGEFFNSFRTIEELTHHEWLLKNPRPPWVKARLRARSLNNIKISCMIRHFLKRHAYIDLESPINVMSRRQYNQIMTYGLGSRQKPSNPNKISNFVGRVRSLKIFIGSFAYKRDFMIVEDTTSIIDHHLGEMAFERPFIDETDLSMIKKKEQQVSFIYEGPFKSHFSKVVINNASGFWLLVLLLPMAVVDSLIAIHDGVMPVMVSPSLASLSLLRMTIELTKWMHFGADVFLSSSIMDAWERYFGESRFDGLLIPFLLSSSLWIWPIEAICSKAVESPADLGTGEIISSLGESRNHLMPFQASFGN